MANLGVNVIEVDGRSSPAIAGAPISNAAFRPLPGFETRATRLEIISVLKGSSSARFMLFQHYASNPQDQIGRAHV